MAEEKLNSDNHSVATPSDDENPKQSIEPSHQKPQRPDSATTKTDEETKKLEEKKKNESESEDEQEDKKSKSESELKEEDTRSSSNTEETKRLREALKRIKDNKAHAIYCPNCSLDITGDVEVYDKKDARYPYDQTTLFFWIPILFPVSLRWCIEWYIQLCQGRTAKPLSDNESPKQVEHTLSSNGTPNPPKGVDDSNISPYIKLKGTILGWIKIYKLYLMVALVLLLLLFIVPWALPSFPGGGSISQGGEIKILGSLSLPSLPLSIHFPNIKYLAIISLFLPAILILASWRKKGPSCTTILKNLNEYIKNPFQKPSIKIDILKSIVYGGLIESITSLGVVSSAAGSGASTLNVLALGVANLFSGFFLIIHSFYELRWRKPYTSENYDHGEGQVAKEDEAKHPYVNMLGDKKLTWLHGSVVLVSLVIFAVIPPLLYGFSYKIIGGEHSKATLVFFVSLVCVISLSYAKAYAFKMTNRLSIVAEYTAIAIAACVLSFFAGHYLMAAVRKYDLH